MASPHVAQFRSSLSCSAAQLRPSEPLRLLVKRKAPLARQGETLGHLAALLRLDFRSDGAHGTLVFEWPTAAATHSIARQLADHAGQLAQRVDVRTDRERSRVKLPFGAADLDDAVAPLFELAGRIGLLDAADAAMQDAVQEAASPEEIAKAAPAVAPPADEVRGVELSPQDARKVDAIEHNAGFDAATHPHVAINDEVVNSSGDAFRLMAKRRNGRQRRVWVRIGRRAVG